VASVCGIIGSAFPLVVAVAVPQVPLVGLFSAIGLLGVLDWLLARNVFGCPVAWGGGLMLGGIIVTVIGIKLNVIG
jgi:hypothetical protein